MMEAAVAKRPSAELGTYAYWRWELRDFFVLLETERDPVAAERAFAALGLVAMRTKTQCGVEETLFAAEIVAAASRFERWQIATLGGGG